MDHTASESENSTSKSLAGRRPPDRLNESTTTSDWIDVAGESNEEEEEENDDDENRPPSTPVILRASPERTPENKKTQQTKEPTQLVNQQLLLDETKQAHHTQRNVRTSRLLQDRDTRIIATDSEDKDTPQGGAYSPACRLEKDIHERSKRPQEKNR